jgi:transcriptional regulator with XRE-family HTH domain
MGIVRRPFGDVLQEVRQTKGMTQQALADGAQIPLATLRNYEQNKRSPSFENALGMARTLGIPLETFADCTFVREQQRPRKVSTEANGQSATTKQTARRRKAK